MSGRSRTGACGCRHCWLIAIASSVAVGRTKVLRHAGNAVPTALTGGFQSALWVLGAIALLALPAIFALIHRDNLSKPATQPTIQDAQPTLGGVN